MDKKAGELMGEIVLAAVRLESPEWMRQAMSVDGTSAGWSGVQRVIGDAVGRAAGQGLVGDALKEASLPGDGGIYYVAVGPTKLGFFSVWRGLIKNSVDRLLVAYLRSDLRRLEIKFGYMSRAHFVFADGTNYVLMCARMQRGKLKKVQELLAPM